MSRNREDIRISDEMVMAYVDGMLEPEEAEQVRQALKTDPLLQKKADVFSETSAMLAVYDKALDEEAPPHLLQTVLTAPAGTWYENLMAKTGEILRTPPWGRVSVFAGLAALCIIIFSVYRPFNRPSPTDNLPVFVQGETFTQAMETVAAGGAARLRKNGLVLLPILSFREKGGGFCRRFEVMAAGHLRAEGIACRRGNGTWRTVAYVQAQAVNEHTGTGEYELAGGEDTVDKIMEERRLGPIITPDGEQALIRRHWRSEP